MGEIVGSGVRADWRTTASACCTRGWLSHAVCSGVSGRCEDRGASSALPRFARTRFSTSKRLIFFVVVRGRSSCQIS